MPKKVKVTKENKSALSVEQALYYIRIYFNETVKDSHGRYMSWRHCYGAFQKSRNNLNDRSCDFLALNLAFYLASWGMYRGSSFLLKKDYKIHIPVVKIIMEKRYNSLMGITAEDIIKDSNLELLEELSCRIRKVYAEEPPAVEGIQNNATDTLITKILLGTLGCVPAYDRYYVQSVKKYGISSGSYNKKSVANIAKYYLLHKREFDHLREELCDCEIQYPDMKLMDMCMWQAAFNDEKSKKLL